ncbi:MAG: CRISPR-associated endonuclease Cas2 [Verrucomicrobiota bacterium]
MNHEPDPPPFDPTNWQESLKQWIKDTPPPPPARLLSGRIPLGWWEEAFTYRPNSSEKRGHPCGAHQMLTIVAYDITDRKRLTKVAKFCEDHGIRVQYSVFECRLEADRFDTFWTGLEEIIDPTTDRLIAYKICLSCAAEIRSAGTQVHQEKVVAYVF